jgi:uncharacterized protein (DUF305 family)
MRRCFPRLTAAAPVVLVAVAACGTGARTPAVLSGAPRSPAALARADGGRPPYTAADVHFISGMIVHHAQAVLIAGWAPTHDAGPAVRALCERIVVAQRDEIAFMQRWLAQRGEPVPDAVPGHAHGGMLMPGMLTAEQLAELDRARGAEFDRLFLTYMIQHHEGAIVMVEALFGANGAGQDEDIFKFAADVNADQTTEIDRMRTMLDAQSPGGRNP